MSIKFYLNISNMRFVIFAPWYIRDACAHLLSEKNQAPDSDHIVLHIKETAEEKVRFIFDNKQNKIDKTIDKEKALFFFFVLLEQIVADNLIKKDPLLIFHGGCFSRHGNAVLVLQGKGAGKTTLIAKMASYRDFHYLADDVALCCSKTLDVWPLPLPLRLRTKDIDDFNLKGRFLGQCVDFNGQTRYLFLPDSWDLNKARLKAVIIPEYTRERSNIFNCMPMNGIEKVKKLTNNIKEISDILEFYTGVLNIAKNSKMYYCEYSGNIEWTAMQLNAFLCANDI